MSSLCEYCAPSDKAVEAAARILAKENTTPEIFWDRYAVEARKALTAAYAIDAPSPQGDGGAEAEWHCGICGREAPDAFRVFGNCCRCAAQKSIDKRNAKIAQLEEEIRRLSTPAPSPAVSEGEYADLILRADKFLLQPYLHDSADAMGLIGEMRRAMRSLSRAVGEKK